MCDNAVSRVWRYKDQACAHTCLQLGGLRGEAWGVLRFIHRQLGRELAQETRTVTGRGSDVHTLQVARRLVLFHIQDAPQYGWVLCSAPVSVCFNGKHWNIDCMIVAQWFRNSFFTSTDH